MQNAESQEAPCCDAVCVERCARRAYEFARLRAGLWSLLFIVPLVLIAEPWRAWSGWWALPAALLALLAVGLLWRGQALGRGVWLGLGAGAIAMCFPRALRSAGHICVGGACMPLCTVACIVGGLVGGSLIGTIVSGRTQSPWVQLLVAATLASLAGALGCQMLGIAGIIGLSLGVFAAASVSLAVNA